MRRWTWAVIVLLALGAGYWGWALLAAAQLAQAAQRHDGPAVVSRVDFPALRRSLARQIALAFLDSTGRSRKMGALGRGMAGAAVTTVADAYVADLITPDTITTFLAEGRIGEAGGAGRTVKLDRTVPSLSGLLGTNLLSRVTGSYFEGPTRFVVPAGGAGAPDGEDYRVHLRLHGLTWQLAGLDLPASVLDDMAHALGDPTAASASAP